VSYHEAVDLDAEQPGPDGPDREPEREGMWRAERLTNLHKTAPAGHVRTHRAVAPSPNDSEISHFIRNGLNGTPPGQGHTYQDSVAGSRHLPVKRRLEPTCGAASSSASSVS
jgi:hypothetical protein